MKVLVFGSANIDRTYSVDHFVVAGETISASNLTEYCGGKGFNQAIALKRAGSDVYFAGAIGTDGAMLEKVLLEEKIDISCLKHTEGPTGHAIIQVTPEGQNCIIISAGANGTITTADVEKVLSSFSEGDMVVLQNEISSIHVIVEKAHEKGMTVVFNPSPFDSRALSCDLEKVDYLLVNETEGNALSGKTDPAEILDSIHTQYHRMNIVLTLGKNGSCFMGKDGRFEQCGIYATKVVDTTAAGDTFTGYFLSELCQSKDIKKALKMAAIASGISVSRKGASQSVPSLDETKTIYSSIDHETLNVSHS